MNRSFIVAAAALGAVTGLAALYSKLTVAAPPAVAAASATPAFLVKASASAAEHSVVAAPTSRPSSNSAEGERLDARRGLYETVEALLQAGELEKARQLLDEDAQRHGDDRAPEWRDFELSYRLIADCLDRPTPEQRARARAFTLVSQAVALKPRILAACK